MNLETKVFFWAGGCPWHQDMRGNIFKTGPPWHQHIKVNIFKTANPPQKKLWFFRLALLEEALVSGSCLVKVGRAFLKHVSKLLVRSDLVWLAKTPHSLGNQSFFLGWWLSMTSRHEGQHLQDRTPMTSTHQGQHLQDSQPPPKKTLVFQVSPSGRSLGLWKLSCEGRSCFFF